MSRNNDIFLQVQKALNERFGSEQGEYVDLGLPSGTLWATYNIGAKEPYEAGLYFAWGETKGHSAEQTRKSKPKQFSKDDYEHSEVESICDSNGILKPEFDAATVNLGNEWRIPTKNEIDELLGLKNKFVKDYNGTGINGRLFVGHNGKSLFLPAAGSTNTGQLSNVGKYGNYWSSSLGEGDDWGAYELHFGEYRIYCSNNGRLLGFSVRPVCC